MWLQAMATHNQVFTVVPAPTAPSVVKTALKQDSAQLLANGNPAYIDRDLRTFNSYEYIVAQLDVAMWYGAIHWPGRDLDAGLLKRIFQTLWYGDLIAKSSMGNYVSYSDTGYPIAMALSHGGRVMIELPPDANNGGHTYWNWLWGGANVANGFRRSAATHGIELLDNVSPLVGGCNRYMKETGGKSVGFKAWLTGDQRHFGVNLALGGLGKINPISGQQIVPNGSHGHLYLFYLAPTANTNGGVLIGCETSAPSDIKISQGQTKSVPKYDQRGVLVSFGTQTYKSESSDTYGGGHGLGSSNKFSGTGGLKWGGKIKSGGTKYQWHSKLKGGKEGLVVDLITGGGFRLNHVMNPAGGAFDEAWLGRPPL